MTCTQCPRDAAFDSIYAGTGKLCYPCAQHESDDGSPEAVNNFLLAQPC